MRSRRRRRIRFRFSPQVYSRSLSRLRDNTARLEKLIERLGSQITIMRRTLFAWRARHAVHAVMHAFSPARNAGARVHSLYPHWTSTYATVWSRTSSATHNVQMIWRQCESTNLLLKCAHNACMVSARVRISPHRVSSDHHANASSLVGHMRRTLWRRMCAVRMRSCRASACEGVNKN